MEHDYKIVGCENYISKELSDKLKENFEIELMEVRGVIHSSEKLKIKPNYNGK